MSCNLSLSIPGLTFIRVVALVLVAACPAWGQGDAGPGGSSEGEVQSGLEDLESRASYLLDRQKIRDLGKRFTRGLDRHDKDLLRSVFWPEATISHGEPMKRDEFVERWLQKLSGYAAHQHHVTGQTVDIDGKTAHVESYVIYFHVPRDKSADKSGPASPGKPLVSEKTYLGSGRYIDRLEKREGEWRIAVREYVEDLALLGETVDHCADQVCLGTWDRTDPSYERPLEHITPEERRSRGENNRRQTRPNADDAATGSDGVSK